jgi:hypothetical protein
LEDGFACGSGLNASEYLEISANEFAFLLIFQVKSNLNPNAKEFVPGVKY